MKTKRLANRTCILLLMILFVTGCSEDNLPEPYEKSLLDISLVSGNNQKGDDTQLLKDSIVFMITDSEGLV